MTEASRSIEGTPYAYESVLDGTIRGIADRVIALRQSGRLTPEVLHHIRKYFRIKNIYHSNAIEGNILDVGETRQVVELGLTLTGKPLKDQAETRNLAHAIDFLEDLAAHSERPILEHDVRQIHTLVLKGVDDPNAGRYRSVPVEISGSAYKPPGPESLPSQMEDFARWLGAASVTETGHGSTEGLIRAAVAHSWFVYIHPFIDGNGRVARLLMNLMLMRYGYPIAIITKEDRLRYYDALEISQTSDLSAFLALLTECIHESLEEYERAAAEQRETQEWARSLGERFSAPERVRAENEYEVWKSAMELLKSYVRQTVAVLNEFSPLGHVFFSDFGTLEFEKYLAFRSGESVKKTWFLRLDFRRGNRAARYLFFFGYASPALRTESDVTLHVAREEPPGSYYYERLDAITAPNVPSLVEIGYQPAAEQFVFRYRNGETRIGKIDQIGRNFFEEVVKVGFST
ncbi:MAG: Fic family protein [Acidobacteria bacterium]|nr:Fic family protein [Acidobacteriota bacterium]